MDTLAIQDEYPGSNARAVAAVQRIGAVPSILRLICKNTGLGFATVARVTDDTWTACAVQDDIAFGLQAGGQLELRTTLCFESRAERKPIVVNHFSQDPVYRNHHTPLKYGLESYISVPIVLSDGTYFGNLCGIDRRPAEISDQRTLNMFEVFADLIALQLEIEGRQDAVERALMNERQTADLREQFIAVLGHDLRNPLSAVSANAELLVRRPERDLVKMGLRQKATTTRMARLIDDVMDFARGRLGSGIAASIVPSDDLASLLRDVVAELSVATPGRDVRERIAFTGRVHCDPARVQQLLSNLLGNAISHGSAAHPVSVEAVIDGATLVLAVSNDGDLIGPDTIQKVFEPYWRPANSVPGGGLGLGLYICKQIVKAHHGTLEVRSSAPDGTCFTARIPV
jgi:signal transduction histidine kinase